MSHITRITTRLVQPEYIRRALRDLNMPVIEGKATVSGDDGQVPVEIGTRTASGRDIGFRFNGKTYDVVADWYYISETSSEPFVRKVSQRYAYHAATEMMARQGFDLVAEERANDGAIRLTLRRIA